ncbi:MAG TPA: hypothetical protein VGZ73_08560, partial [Bryobacteraceae bacterium]|nr:hypothetical protein [Bryobacteraceae bacterium]
MPQLQDVLDSLKAHANPANVAGMARYSRSIRLALVTVFCACLAGSSALGAGPAAPETPGVSDADPVVHELCGKRIALLGESPSHGYGRTMQFKTEL